MDECAKKISTDGGDIQLLKILLRQNVEWGVKKERYDFIRNLCLLIKVWEGELPNLRDFFSGQEIEDILFDCVNYWRMDDGCTVAITDFLVRCGYRDEPTQFDENGKLLLNRTTPLHHVARSVWTPQRAVTLRDLFVIYDRYDANYSDEDGFSHFHVACKYGLPEVVEKFLAAGQRPDCRVQCTGDTPLHVALTVNGLEVAQMLLRRSADSNLRNAVGMTPLHVICERARDDDLTRMFLELSYDKYRKLEIDLPDKWGRTPLLVSVSHELWDLTKLLLRRGADPNAANKDGSTALHIICARERDPYVRVTEFFLACYKKRRTVNVNHQDRHGRTPLLLALSRGRCEVFEFLLKNGANPHLADADGRTALHIIAARGDEHCAHKLLRLSFYNGFCPLWVDARDKFGNTPLHLALRYGHTNLAAYLLRCGAYPNLIDKDGATPLHLICSQEEVYDEDGHSLESFFEINDQLLQGVLINERDKKGRTSLQLAVANVFPAAVELLLAKGADASSFVFPAARDFDCEKLRTRCQDRFITYELWLAAGLMAAVDSLEKAGWELNRGTVETIMKLFADNGLFERSTNLQQCSHRKDWEALMINSSVSLYDLTRLTPKEAKKRVTFMNYFRSAHDIKWWQLFYVERVPLAVTLCEKFARKFFEFWALEPFMQLIHCRMPIECCETVLESLKNEDLYNMCSAAREENAETVEDADPVANPETGMSHAAALRIGLCQYLGREDWFAAALR
uniref:Uncharacterized protein n=1 Tax=Trichogramma kaykai TaxID=54128 RepID=A0ABD2W7F8_9HYME